MNDALAARNKKAFKEFEKDLELYRDASGRANNEVLARQALNFSIRYRKLLYAEAPSREEINNLGPRLFVRKSIREKLGIGDDYTGRTNKKLSGAQYTKKRALAVRREINKRRASVRWLGKSVAVWKKEVNANLKENSSPNLGFAHTRGKKSVVGRARGKFSKNRDFVRFRAMAYNIKKVDREKGGLHLKALQDTSADIKNYARKKYASKGAILGKAIKRSY